MATIMLMALALIGLSVLLPVVGALIEIIAPLVVVLLLIFIIPIGLIVIGFMLGSKKKGDDSQ